MSENYTPILLQEDIRQTLSKMKDESVDLILTDPPYRTISGGKSGPKGRPSGILSKNDGKIFKHNDIDISEYISGLYRVLKDQSHMYMMVNLINLVPFWKAIEGAGFQIHNLLVWEKNNVVVNRWYMKNAEYVIFARKGRAKMILNQGSKTVHSFDNVLGGRSHPTEKPVDLMRFYIENSSKVGDTVFDPFMGTGATGVAAIEANRNFIGVEIDPDYFIKAKERITG